MSELGDALRAQRERMGITLEQAAEDTRIREKFLRALESGDHQVLPGAVYTKGFLRNYADYLGLEADQLIALYVSERGGSEPQRSFQPMRPVMRRTMIFTPAVLVPFVILAAVALFLGYLYYQFSTFAVAPRLEVTEPAGDVIATQPELVLRGRTLADARVTIRVFPGPETLPEVKPASDGSFTARVTLKPGANHIEVRVFDSAGKSSEASRTIQYQPQAAVSDAPAGPQLVIEQPANGATYTNAPVTVSGRVVNGVTAVAVNGAAVATQPDGRFTVSVTFQAGQQVVRVVARTATGAEVQEARTVTVAYTSAVVTVRIAGGEAWLVAIVDGAQVPDTGRVFADGRSVTFTGKQVTIRTGNAGATFVSYNGQDLGKLGEVGQIAERTFPQ